MSTVYFIEETIYGNSFTDSEIIFACLDEDQAKAQKARLEAWRLEHKKFEYSYSLTSCILTEKVSKQSARCALPCTCPKSPLGFVMAIAHDCPEHGGTSQ